MTSARSYSAGDKTRSGQLFSVAFSADGKRLFTVSDDAVALWELVPSPEIVITRETDARIVLTWQNPAHGPP